MDGKWNKWWVWLLVIAYLPVLAWSGVRRAARRLFRAGR